jgi:predicted PurR-regulated permease PerM
MLDNSFLDTIKILLEIAALVFLPVIVWLLKTVVSHNKQLTVLEEKVNAEINRRLDVMERKLDTFDNKIEQKIDRLESNLNSKIDIMTSIVTTLANNNSVTGSKKEK